MKFNVEILETYVKNFEIEANSEEAALEIAREKYSNEEENFVLDASDCIGTDFSVQN